MADRRTTTNRPTAADDTPPDSPLGQRVLAPLIALGRYGRQWLRSLLLSDEAATTDDTDKELTVIVEDAHETHTAIDLDDLDPESPPFTGHPPLDASHAYSALPRHPHAPSPVEPPPTVTTTRHDNVTAPPLN